MSEFTPEQIERARVKYEADLSPDDWSDWVLGLEFVMATYNPRCWMKYFEDELNGNGSA